MILTKAETEIGLDLFFITLILIFLLLPTPNKRYDNSWDEDYHHGHRTHGNSDDSID